MTAIHLQVSHDGWRRALRRRRRGVGRLIERALAAVREWRRRRRMRGQITALDARISRDIGICRGDPLDLDREQKERQAWLDTLSFSPF